MAQLRGFFYPQTATGASSLLPAPPWRYSGDLLTVEYRTRPERVAELLPDPLRPAPEDPGAVAIIWADWQSCGADGSELLDPVRSQYKEAFVVVRCAFEDEIFSRCVYIWVDKDFAVGRGLHQGYPKKLGSIHATRPHAYGPAPTLAAGGRFGATLAAADRRLAEAIITLVGPAETNGFVNGHPMAHNRTVRAIDDPGRFRLNELISSSTAAFEGGTPWQATVDHFALFESPTEEIHQLEPLEVIGAYYRQVGTTWDGGTVLHDDARIDER